MGLGMAHVVYSGVGGHLELQGKLFEGIKFWISQKVPQRTRFVDEVKSNGGEILPLEKQADVKIVDHARKQQLPGTHSYTFVEKSVRNGVLEDLADHAVGPPEGSIRNVGSIIRPAKGTRSKYTAVDDCILWDWVSTTAQQGGGTDGNEIYKQLETKHPQHPWQSWRDRYIKKLKGRPRPYAVPHNAPPTPPADLQTPLDHISEPAPKMNISKDGSANFTDDDVRALMSVGADILRINPKRVDEAWKKWASDFDSEGAHDAKQWQNFWEENVRPRYQEKEARRRRLKAEKKNDSVGNVKSEVSAKQDSDEVKAKHVTPASNRTPPIRSPSYRPENPTAYNFSSTRSPRQTRDESFSQLPSFGRATQTGILDTVPSSQALKRKLVDMEEELPSSSPPVKLASPNRFSKDGLDLRREIPSTPDKGPSQDSRLQDDSLPIKDEEEDNNIQELFNLVDSDEVKIKRQEDGMSTDNELEEITLFRESPHEEDSDAHVTANISSSPDRSRGQTQAIFKEPTPMIDFDVPEPDEGWGHSKLGDTHGDFGMDRNTKTSEPDNPTLVVLDTQAVFRSTTPIPDLDLPSPEGGWGSLPPSSPQEARRQDQNSASEASSSLDRDQLDAWVASYEQRGFLEKFVLEVVDRSSIDIELAGKVLDSLQKGKEKSRGGSEYQIPHNWRGVWTAADDQDLFSTDARKISRLQAKHGEDLLRSRWEYLEYLKEVD